MHRRVSLKLGNQREHRVAVKQSSAWSWKEQNSVVNNSSKLIFKKKKKEEERFRHVWVCEQL